MSYEGKSREQLIAELETLKIRLDEQQSNTDAHAVIEERFRLAMEACKDGVWDTNFETGHMYYSPGYTAMLGYMDGTFPAHVSIWSDLVHPDDKEAVLTANRDCIENRIDSFSVEFRMKTQSGKWLWILGRGQAVLRDSNGQALRLVGTHTDITQLKISDDLFHSLFETASSAIVTINLQGTYTSWNSVWCDMLGYTHEEMPALNAFDVTHTDDLDEGGRNVASLIKGEISGYRQEKRFIRKDGSILWGDLSASALKNSNGEVESLLGVITDISKYKKAEKAARSSEQRYRAIVNSMSSGMAVYEAIDDGADFIFKEFNPAAEETTLIDRKQALGSSLLRMFPNLAQTEFVRALGRVWRTGLPENIPPFLYKDHMSEGWKENRIYKLPTGEVVALFDDVTERIQANQALEASEQRLKLALNAVNDAVWDWKIDTDEVYFSPRWYTMLGYEPYEFPQNFEVWKNLLHPEDRSWATGEVQRHLESGESFRIEMRMRTKDDQWCWILARGMVVEVDKSGKATRMIGTHIDISNRIQAMHALKESEQRFRNLLENVEMVAVRGYNDKQQVIFWNKACEDLYGYTQDEILEQGTEHLIIQEDHRETIVHMINSWITDNIPFPTGEFTFLHKDGSLRSVYSSNAMQINSQGNREIYFIDVDLTEINMAYSQLIEAKEQAEAASNAKSMFLANMSHELRTPLNGIMGMHHVLERTTLDKQQQQYLDLAQTSAQRLTNLLNDILDLTRVEAGRMELKTRQFNIIDTLKDIEQLFKASSSQEGVTCRFHADQAIPSNLVGDPARLQQILNNLVGNALKFTQTGTIDVNVYPLPISKDRDCTLLFSVSDTGTGISDETQKSIFQSFTQGDEGFTRSHQGAGLGLSIVKQLVSLMGGNMSVDSNLGEGTTFYFSLPFSLENLNEAKATTVPHHSLYNSSHLKALLVEDDLISQMVFQKLLEYDGCKVHIADDGKQAIQALQEQSFDVIFMDVQMPVMNGVTATRAIRSGESGDNARNTPIIAMTAFAMTGDKEMLLAAGMDDYIEKPVEIELLQTVLENIRNSVYTAE
ncbi:PAS domain-containing protein [Desulfosediminicola flagellatus]|uniref:PAS domain-containing protein n=1 Tax=Desulfosediminicola flagellatus TaxID=2569541 RepID=UPI0010AB9FA4|nr:PAS domain-containing protein [Desulfosediminicola flagellatus]